MHRRRVLTGLALGLAAAAVDAQSPAAVMWLARCASTDVPSAVGAALRIDEHATAFPVTMAVMVWRCLWPARGVAPPGLRAALQALVGMLLLMPAACLLAALLASPVAPAWQPWCYGAWMTTLGGLPGLARWRGRWEIGRTNVWGRS